VEKAHLVVVTFVWRLAALVARTHKVITLLVVKTARVVAMVAPLLAANAVQTGMGTNTQ